MEANPVYVFEEYTRNFQSILDNLRDENTSLEISRDHHQSFIKMLNQKIAMTHKENADVLKKISEVDSLTVIEELKQASLNDESENFILDDLEREYAKELAALTEKINNYKEVFQIDIQSNKEKKFVWITFMGAEQTIKIEYKNIKSIKAFVEEFSDRVVEAEKDEAIKKLVKQFNSLRDVKPNITDFIVKLSEQLKNV